MKNFVIDSSHPGYLDNVLGKSFGLKINGMVYVPSKTFYKKTVMPSMAPLVLRFNLNYRKISISLHGSLTHKTGFSRNKCKDDRVRQKFTNNVRVCTHCTWESFYRRLQHLVSYIDKFHFERVAKRCVPARL